MDQPQHHTSLIQSCSDNFPWSFVLTCVSWWHGSMEDNWWCLRELSITSLLSLLPGIGSYSAHLYIESWVWRILVVPSYRVSANKRLVIIKDYQSYKWFHLLDFNKNRKWWNQANFGHFLEFHWSIWSGQVLYEVCLFLQNNETFISPLKWRHNIWISEFHKMQYFKLNVCQNFWQFHSVFLQSRLPWEAIIWIPI